MVYCIHLSTYSRQRSPINKPSALTKERFPKAQIKAKPSSQQNRIVALSTSRVELSVVPVLLPTPINPNKTPEPTKQIVPLSACRTETYVMSVLLPSRIISSKTPYH